MGECVGQYFITDEGLIPCASLDEKSLYKGLSLYEVIRVIDGVPLFVEDHISRLFESSKASSLNIRYTPGEIIASVHTLIDTNRCDYGNIKIVISYPDTRTGVFFAFFIRHYYPTPEQYASGVRAILYPAERENPTVKVININLRTIVYNAIILQGAYEALLVNAGGFITEGSRSNFFVIRKGTVITAPDSHVLPGISRKYILTLCDQKKIPVTFDLVHNEDLTMVDAAFLSGTSPGVLPLAQVAEHRYATDNRILRSIMKEYDTLIHTYVKQYKQR